jgi:L-fuculose-phosphate aldolase
VLSAEPMYRSAALFSPTAKRPSAEIDVGRRTGMGTPMKPERMWGLRLSIIEGGRELTMTKLITLGEGNLSARIDKDRFLVTPTMTDKAKLEPDELMEVEINSHRVPEGASTEVGLHRAIYVQFPSVHSVVHAHPAKVLALAEEGLAPDASLLPDGGSILDRVSWIDDFPPGSRSLAQEVALGIAKAPALVIAAHGAVTIGATVDQAVLRMIRLERLALMTRGG